MIGLGRIALLLGVLSTLRLQARRRLLERLLSAENVCTYTLTERGNTPRKAAKSLGVLLCTRASIFAAAS